MSVYQTKTDFVIIVLCQHYCLDLPVLFDISNHVISATYQKSLGESYVARILARQWSLICRQAFLVNMFCDAYGAEAGGIFGAEIGLLTP